MPEWQALFSALREHDIKVSDKDMPRPVHGGDISAAWQVKAADQPVFLKTGPSSAYDMFLAEAEGLKELALADAVRVPMVLGCVRSNSECMLALEWIDFDLPGKDTAAKLGEQLTKQHRLTREQFGWHRDNTIGATPQLNPWRDDWIEFFRDQRLGFQLQLAAEKGHTGELQQEGDRLLSNIGQYFNDYWPEASLLHGDLWGGNWASAKGQPVIFDPAVYYGDRESDLAMTMLFGGFPADFYRAYESSWPLAPGSDQRMELYKLYHVLNHLNLFGRSYYGRALSLIRSLS